MVHTASWIELTAQAAPEVLLLALGGWAAGLGGVLCPGDSTESDLSRKASMSPSESPNGPLCYSAPAPALLW